MKKIISIFLSLALCFSLAACGSGSDSTLDNSIGNETDNVTEEKTLEYPFGVVNAPMDLNGGYSYKTVCYDDTSLETNGYVYIRDYSVTPVEGEEGMVDRSVLAGFVYNDDNAYYNGTMTRVAYSDIKGDGILDGAEEWSVDIDGEEKNITVLEDEFIYREWLANRVFVSFYRLTLRTPEAYDDIALFFYNAKNSIALSPDGEEMPENTSITSLIDSDTQWFILSNEAGTYYGSPVELQNAQVDPEVIIYDRLFECEAPPPPPGSEIYDLLPPQPSEKNEGIVEEIPEENYQEIPEEPIVAEDDFDDTVDYDSVWLELQDVTVDTIDGNAGYQCINFFLETHGWYEDLQTRYFSFSDKDGVIQDFTLPAMEHGSVSMDITGTDIQADVVTFGFSLIDEYGMEISSSYMDIPVVR